jgi:hypothetical protein
MSNKPFLSRRNFMKSTAVASSALIGASVLSACSEKGINTRKPGKFPENSLKNYQPSDGVAGLLFSQIGYEPGLPVRVVVRLPKKELLQGKTTCKLTPVSGEKNYETEFIYHSQIWGSHWWVADFRNINEAGEWNIEVLNGSDCVFADSGLQVSKNILWEKTIEYASVDMLERRVHFTGVGAGWQDAGTLWVESPAQSAMVISLEELLELKKDTFDTPFQERIYTQIAVGCDYLVMTQNKAEELGFPKGSMSHDIKGHEKDILPHDAMKAVVALTKAVQLLPEKFADKKYKYVEAAKRAFQWLVTSAKPMGEYGYVKMQRGLPADAVIPKDEWLTRDLLMMCRASLEMLKLGDQEAKELAIDYGNKVMARQISKENAESGFYGHFYEFVSMKHSEPSWCHGIVPGKNGVEFGADMGGIYPNYLMPLIDLLKLWPDHSDAAKWKETLHNFATNYLIPACEQNPFYLVPQGIFGDEGAIWFCGTFHGTSAIYGYTAALALELSTIFNEPKLKEIAYGNLQWLAGLNAGISRENLKLGCVVFSTDVPEGAALPASMMCGVGNRWAGTWFQTRGVICNGFSTGEQFKYDVEPKKINDGPFSLTDEDWIPHSAGWLTGLMRL